ncbi:hypothetical protein B566_EDAN008527 [Ephemera danica]|nr:hypothetical protein B566_EDAN008527 [Ephemera danica]
MKACAGDAEEAGEEQQQEIAVRTSLGELPRPSSVRHSLPVPMYRYAVTKSCLLTLCRLMHVGACFAAVHVPPALPVGNSNRPLAIVLRRSFSLRSRHRGGENTVNGDDAHQSTFSEEGSPTKDLSTEGSPKKDKKKKKGLRTPSFLKKKQKKKVAESAA